MAIIMKGAPAAAALSENLAARVQVLKEKNIVPTLAIVRVGDKASDAAYIRGAVRAVEKIGAAVEHYTLPDDCTQQELETVIASVSADDKIHGCLLLCPLPKHIDEQRVISLLAPEKDLDGLTVTSAGALLTERGAGYPPCTAQACIELLEHYGIELNGKHAAVIGRSNVVGKPAALLLLRKNATVTVCHSKTQDIRALTRNADIVIAAVGRAEMIDASYLRPGQVIVDVGINGTENGICGDVNFSSAEPLAAAISPVPGGVGTVTSAVLAKHLIEAAERKNA